MILISVFFFFGTRLQRNLETQRELTEYQERQGYLESYAGFIQSIPGPDLPSLTSVDFDTITGTLSRETPEITGFLDVGAPAVSYAVSDPVTIEWNQCEFGESGELLVSEMLHPHAGDCGGGAVFADNFSLNPGGTLTLFAPSGPVHYQIKNPAGEPLADTAWHLDLSMPQASGKTLEMKETFSAS